VSAANDRLRVALENLKRALRRCCGEDMKELRTGYLTCIKCGKQISNKKHTPARRTLPGCDTITIEKG
jgi:hypothetical protein